ncbi:hypothetical protein HWV23_05810 [Natronomonas halophila]|uniref:DUF5787 family protein n=1 Tax=Natronomonas halophila TaxID=2747817 RepID=UPI0015B4A8B9|nr:DUF5787 family protein [Natronomonas halophila]QLD85260.1 hypothetical protein HWV23_05810 [Natronomonas halophila]
MREYAFELAMCAAVEADSDGLVARQLGSHTRIVDAVEVLPGPDFSARTEVTAEAIPDLAIESEVGVGRARYWKDAVDAAPDRAESAVDRAVDIGFFTDERRNGRRYVRQTARYPEWFDGLRAFENKPDLGRPGDLQLQLRKDVSLGLFDEVVLVTESYVTGAHLNRIPESVGVWRFSPDEGRFEVIREATPLASSGPGIAVLDETPTKVDIEPVTADEKARYRRRIAERAYGKGWRPDALPACEKAEARGPEFRPDDALPYCGWKGRFVDPARECGADCDGYAAADPPEADVEAARARHSPWNPDPEGRERRQVGLDRFGEE